MHVCHVPVTLPRRGRKTNGIFVFDLAKAQSQICGFDVGVLHPFLLRVDRKSLICPSRLIGQLRYNIDWFDGAIYSNYILDSSVVRESVNWRDEVLRLYKRYCKTRGAPDLIHCHSGLGAGEAGLDIYEKYRVPFIVTEHNPAFIGCDFNPEKKLRLQRVYEKATKTTVVSDAMYECASSIYDNVTVLPNVLSEQYFEVNDFSNRENDSYILCVGSLKANKQFDVAIKIYALLRKFGYSGEMFIVGEGEEKNSLGTIATEYGISDSVVFLGNQGRSALKKIYAGADLLISASIKEPFCLPIVEAQAQGCPVLCTNSGGPANFGQALSGVKYFDYQDTRGCVNMAFELIQKSKESGYKRKFHQECLEVFSPRAVLRKLSDIYKQRV